VRDVEALSRLEAALILPIFHGGLYPKSRLGLLFLHLQPYKNINSFLNLEFLGKAPAEGGNNDTALGGFWHLIPVFLPRGRAEYERPKYAEMNGPAARGLKS
jgi:hypothetical protein